MVAGVVFGTCWPSFATAKDVQSASASKFHEPIWWKALTRLNLTFYSPPYRINTRNAAQRWLSPATLSEGGLPRARRARLGVRDF